MNKLLEFKNVSLTYQTLTDEINAIGGLNFNCQNYEFLSNSLAYSLEILVML